MNLTAVAAEVLACAETTERRVGRSFDVRASESKLQRGGRKRGGRGGRKDPQGERERDKKALLT